MKIVNSFVSDVAVIHHQGAEKACRDAGMAHSVVAMPIHRITIVAARIRGLMHHGNADTRLESLRFFFASCLFVWVVDNFSVNGSSFRAVNW